MYHKIGEHPNKDLVLIENKLMLNLWSKLQNPGNKLPQVFLKSVEMGGIFSQIYIFFPRFWRFFLATDNILFSFYFLLPSCEIFPAKKLRVSNIFGNFLLFLPLLFTVIARVSFESLLFCLLLVRIVVSGTFGSLWRLVWGSLGEPAPTLVP